MNPALIMVDVIRAFFDDAGIHHYDEVHAVEPALERLLAQARAHDRVVAHAVERHRRGLPDFEQPKLPEHCLEGDFQSEFWPGFEPVERAREIVVPKRRYSAFFATDLALTLRELDIDTVVVAGVKTNVCIRATCQDAFAHGFAVVVPHDATNSNRPHLAAASLEDVARYFGDTPSTDEVLTWL